MLISNTVCLVPFPKPHSWSILMYEIPLFFMYLGHSSLEYQIFYKSSALAKLPTKPTTLNVWLRPHKSPFEPWGAQDYKGGSTGSWALQSIVLQKADLLQSTLEYLWVPRTLWSHPPQSLVLQNWAGVCWAIGNKLYSHLSGNATLFCSATHWCRGLRIWWNGYHSIARYPIWCMYIYENILIGLRTRCFLITYEQKQGTELQIYQVTQQCTCQQVALKICQQKPVCKFTGNWQTRFVTCHCTAGYQMRAN